jgi:hypothetical protein
MNLFKISDVALCTASVEDNVTLFLAPQKNWMYPKTLILVSRYTVQWSEGQTVHVRDHERYVFHFASAATLILLKQLCLWMKVLAVKFSYKANLYLNLQRKLRVCCELTTNWFKAAINHVVDWYSSEVFINVSGITVAYLSVWKKIRKIFRIKGHNSSDSLSIVQFASVRIRF